MRQGWMHTTATTSRQVLVIDDGRRHAAAPSGWVRALRTAGIRATVQRPVAPQVWTNTDIGRSVAIGSGTEAETAHRLLTAGRVAAAVLLHPVFVPESQWHGPLLLIEPTKPDDDAIAQRLRPYGNCDQRLTTVTEEAGADLNRYIHSWLVFHQLLTPQGDPS